MSNFEDALKIVETLSPSDKVRLLEHLRTDIIKPSSEPRPSLYGLWAGVSISAEEIDEARREMWKNFPREDI